MGMVLGASGVAGAWGTACLCPCTQTSAVVLSCHAFPSTYAPARYVTILRASVTLMYHVAQEYHSSREGEHRARDRLGGRFTPYPWADAAAAVLADEVLEDEELVVALIRELGRQGEEGQGRSGAASFNALGTDGEVSSRRARTGNWRLPAKVWWQ